LLRLLRTDNKPRILDNFTSFFGIGQNRIVKIFLKNTRKKSDTIDVKSQFSGLKYYPHK
jgi:hypothetical protein